MRPSKTVAPALLRTWPLPVPAGGDKNDRGCVLVIAGAAEMPGAAVLAGTAALRAGAGKMQIATDERVAAAVGTAVPEALVTGFDRGLALARAADAVVLGPGMADHARCASLLAWLAAADAPLVLDAAALTALKTDGSDFKGRRVPPLLTPHAGEMATLLDERKAAIEHDPARYALAAAQRFGAVVALKGAQTFVADPDGALYVNRAGTVGLATAGSGDTLAGIAGGLLARGLSPLAATCWAVYAHARAGEALMKKVGLGFLARELTAQIPGILRTTNARR